MHSHHNHNGGAIDEHDCSLNHDIYGWEFVDHHDDGSHIHYVIRRDHVDPAGGYNDGWLDAAADLHAVLGNILNDATVDPTRHRPTADHNLRVLRDAYIDAHCLLYDHAGPAKYDALDAARDALVTALRDTPSDRAV